MIETIFQLHMIGENTLTANISRRIVSYLNHTSSQTVIYMLKVARPCLCQSLNVCLCILHLSGLNPLLEVD